MTLSVSHLCKEYPTRAEPLVVLRDVSLTLEPGESLAIMGPSGAGKSTLLYIIGTLDRPTSGTVTFKGQNPFQLPEPQLAAFRNQRVGFVFQDHHLLPQCTALENVLVPTVVNRHASKDRSERARALLDRVGLGARFDHAPSELSGGERQRVAIARALINRPTVVLADEPTGNLDRRTAHAIGELLADLSRQEEVILIVVTHSQELASRFPRRVELLDGDLQPCG